MASNPNVYAVAIVSAVMMLLRQKICNDNDNNNNNNSNEADTEKILSSLENIVYIKARFVSSKVI